jgi:hypothetical protein
VARLGLVDWLFSLIFCTPSMNFTPATDQWQESGAIQPPPALLGHVEQLECHEQPFGSRACTFGHALTQAHSRERRFNLDFRFDSPIPAR